MGNNKPFKVKNSVQAPAYYESLGTVETKTGDGWDLSSLLYTNKASYDGFSNIGGSYLRSFVFKPDGTKLWAIGAGGTFAGYMYEFNLSTPWDISTLAYAGISFNLDTNGMASQVSDFVISDDGTKAIFIDTGQNYLEEASMNPAWDISTIAQVDNTNIGGQETNPNSIISNNDGTRIYYNGTSNRTIRQLNLPNPWDLTGFSASGSYTIVEDTSPESMAFNRDGTKIFVYGRTNRKIYTYNLSTPYAISTASYSGEAIDLPSLLPTGYQLQTWCVRFKPDGSQFYVMVQDTTLGDQKIYQFSTTKDIYTLDTSTGSVFDLKISNQSEIRIEDRTTWDITATANSSTNWVLTGDHLNGDIKQLATLGSHIFIEVDDVLRITNNANSMHPFYIKYTQGAGTDDQVLGVTGNGGHSGAVIEWTPNEVGDFYYQCSSHNNMWGEIHVVPKGEDRRFQTRYGVEFAGRAGFSNEITGATQLRSIAVSSDGNHLYAVGEGQLRQYSLSTPYDITTKTYVQADGGGVEGNAQNRQAIVFSTDGDMYFVVHTDDVIHRIELSTPWDITTASYSNNSIDVAAVTTEAFDFDISRDGKYMYVGEYTNKRIHKYYLTTPWDLTTAIRDPNYLNDAAINTGLRGVAVSNDGKHIIATDNSELVWQFDPRVPYGSYNISGARDLYGGVDLPNSSTAIRVQHSYNGEYIYVTSDASNKFADQYRISGPVSDAEEVKSASVVLSYENMPAGSYDIEDLEYNTFIDLNRTDIQTGFAIKDDGTRVYVASSTGSPSEKVQEFELTIPYDISSINTTPVFTFDIGAINQMNDVLGLTWRPDGSRFYIPGRNGANTTGIAEFRCSNPWALNSASFQAFAGWPTTGAGQTGTAGIRDIQWYPDGGSYYVLNRTYSKIQKWTVTVAWEINASYAYANDEFEYARDIVGSEARSFSFSPDGEYLFIAQYPKMYRFILTTPWQLSSATYDGVVTNLNDTNVLPEPNGLIVSDSHAWSPDGTILYAPAQSNEFYQFDVKKKPLITYGSNIQWRSGYAPAAPEANETDVLTFTSQNNGLTYEGVLAIDGAK